jgi:hypothetical protein
MSILRMGHDEWGRTVTDGLSWDLLPVFFWAAVVIIVVHAIFAAVTGARRRRGE